MEPVPERFEDGKQLAGFFQETFPMTEEEGQKLMDYLNGHGYLLGHMDGEMFRGDSCDGQDQVCWEPYSIDDAVDAAAEWNYELLREAEKAVPDSDLTDKETDLAALREDERILDRMFDRTKYAKEIDALAAALAEAFIADLGREGGIDAAVKRMTEQIKAGEDLLPDVSPALKKNAGRPR